MKRFLPWIILGVAAACIAGNWLPPKTPKDDFEFSKFGEIPVLVGGRMKPLYTVARNSLLIIHGKQELRLENGKRLTAMQWLTDTLFNASVADQYPVFIVQNADVLGLFGWQQSDRKYFSFAEFSPFLKQIDEQAAQSDKLEAVQRSAYQSAILLQDDPRRQPLQLPRLIFGNVPAGFIGGVYPATAESAPASGIELDQWDYP